MKKSQEAIRSQGEGLEAVSYHFMKSDRKQHLLTPLKLPVRISDEPLAPEQSRLERFTFFPNLVTEVSAHLAALVASTFECAQYPRNPRPVIRIK